jgi:hypothetical protein
VRASSVRRQMWPTMRGQGRKDWPSPARDRKGPHAFPNKDCSPDGDLRFLLDHQ